MRLESKSLLLEAKAGSRGDFSATFATFDVIDHDGDVTLADAFPEGKEVLVGAYQHASEALPVGKGVIHSDGTSARIDGSFFVDTVHGEATYRTVKHAGSLLEWSYKFRVIDSEHGTFHGQSVRFLKEVDVWSVDPVLKGAGIGTGTVSVKRWRDDSLDPEQLYLRFLELDSRLRATG